MKKKRFLLLEILAVALLIGVLAILGVDKYNEFFNNYKTYRVKFNDVDGLSIGSPVRFSGVHIGHVTKQDLKNDKIMVTFKITNRDIKLPKGSQAGVEFTGLAGSRSLEIKPPKTDTCFAKELQKIEPIRVTSYIEIQKTLSEATLDFFNGILAFFRQNEKDSPKAIKNISETIKEKAASFEKMQETVKKKSEEAAEKAKQIKTFIEDTNKNVNNLNKTVTKLTKDTDLNEGLEKLNEAAKSLSTFLESEKLQKTDKTVKKLNSKIIEIKDNEIKYINEFNGNVKKNNDKLQNFINSHDDK